MHSGMDEKIGSARVNYNSSARESELIDGENEDEFDAAMDGYDSLGDRSGGSSDSGDEEDMDVINENPTNQSKPLTFNSSADHIPISRHGMAVCEHCGSIGIRDAFYSKTKQYCSMACSRAAQNNSSQSPSSQLEKRGCSTTVIKNSKSSSSTRSDQMTDESLTNDSTNDASHNTSADASPKPDLSSTFCWEKYLSTKDIFAAPVSCFPHVAMSHCWDNITVGMKLEVVNNDCDNFSKIFPTSYWIAMVLRITGYKAQLRYEGYGQDNSKDFWINLCKDPVYPVGWCASQRKPLVPPKSIQHKYSDWKDFLVKRLIGSRTLPANFQSEVQKAINYSNFSPGMQLEVVDKNRISVVRVAVLDHVIGGRIHVRYQGTDSTDEGFWCHQKSPLIHPVGWAAMVGHSLRATADYAKSSLQKALLQKYGKNDASWDLFPTISSVEPSKKFKVGMKLETIDPLNLSTICVATVMRVLRNDYLMIGIDGMMEENGADWFCYHATSPTILPAGFCELNNIILTPPKGWVGKFNWFDYLKSTNSMAAPVSLFNQEVNTCCFKPGMKIEAVDLMEPRLICVATVTHVIGRLLRIHFDGWEDNYDQWCDCESVDIYPVGWSESVSYPLEPPRNFAGAPSTRRKKSKGMMYRGPRRNKCKKRNSLSLSKPPHLVSIKQQSSSDASSQNSPTAVPDSRYSTPLSATKLKIKLEPPEEEREDILVDTSDSTFFT
ncbi:MBTD1 (predicted) [Pycnogonum litorale]